MTLEPSSYTYRPTGSSTGNFLRSEFGVSSEYVLVSEHGNSPPYIWREGGNREFRVGKDWLRSFFPPAFRARVKFIKKAELSFKEVEYFYAMKAAINRNMGRADSDPRDKNL